LLSSVFVNAQIQTEDFEAGVLPTGWTSTIISGGFDWTFGSGVMPGGAAFATNAAIFDDDAAGASELNNTVDLISPDVDITSYSTVNLNFEYSMQAYVAAGFLTVEVWNGTAWVQVLISETDTPPTVVDIDVTAYINAAFKVRFHYDDELDYAWGAGIDNFNLTGTTLGVRNYDSAKFSVYPNPVENLLTISTTEAVSNIRILNSLGQLVSNVDAKNNSVDVSKLSQGVYFIKFAVDGKEYTNKFSKK
jgi:Secretion system C-terminal sorting domain